MKCLAFEKAKCGNIFQKLSHVQNADYAKKKLLAKVSTSLTLLTIILSGDLQVNPGPSTHAQVNLYPCGVCEAPVTEHDKAIDCDEYQTWLHISCIGITDRDYETLHSKPIAWICYKCSSPNFSNRFYEEIQSNFINSFSTISTLDTDIEEEYEDAIQQPTSRPNRTKPVNRKLKIMTVNVQGIKGKGKQKELELLFDIEKPDIVMGTESHLTDEYPDSIYPEDYLVWRKDRNGNVWGVFVAYKNDLIVTDLPEFGENCELK